MANSIFVTLMSQNLQVWACGLIGEVLKESTTLFLIGSKGFYHIYIENKTCIQIQVV